MTMPPTPTADDGERDADSATLHRRRFLALGASAGAVLLAGCAGDGNGDSPSTRTQQTGTFRLLISDRPNDIDDFDSLDVTFDRAHVFREEGDDESETATPTATPENGTATPTATATPENGTATATETPDGTATPVDTEDEAETDEEDEESEDVGDFTTIDLEGKTVATKRRASSRTACRPAATRRSNSTSPRSTASWTASRPTSNCPARNSS